MRMLKLGILIMLRQFILIILLGFAIFAHAQTDRVLIRDGNRMFRKQNYSGAEVQYRKALVKNAENGQAIYNLGCALMMQNKDSAAVIQFQTAAKLEKNKQRLAAIYHNIGVVCQNHKMYDDAIKAYQQALRNNPNDDETRYNLALCKTQQKKNKNKNDKDKNKDKNKNDNKNNNKNNNNNQNKDKDKQSKSDKKMSKENAEQLLNAAVQNERNTQQRLMKAIQKPARARRSQKNW